MRITASRSLITRLLPKMEDSRNLSLRVDSTAAHPWLLASLSSLVFPPLDPSLLRTAQAKPLAKWLQSYVRAIVRFDQRSPPGNYRTRPVPGGRLTSLSGVVFAPNQV